MTGKGGSFKDNTGGGCGAQKSGKSRLSLDFARELRKGTKVQGELLVIWQTTRKLYTLPILEETDMKNRKTGMVPPQKPEDPRTQSRKTVYRVSQIVREGGAKRIY